MGTEELVRSLESVVFLSWKSRRFRIRTGGLLLQAHLQTRLEVVFSQQILASGRKGEGSTGDHGREGSRDNL